MAETIAPEKEIRRLFHLSSNQYKNSIEDNEEVTFFLNYHHVFYSICFFLFLFFFYFRVWLERRKTVIKSYPLALFYLSCLQTEIEIDPCDSTQKEKSVSKRII